MDKDKRLGCFGVVLKMFGGVFVGDSDGSHGDTDCLPYRRKDWLLTRAERSFFGVLHDCVGAEFFIFSKVRLADVFFIPRGVSSRQAAFNRIQSKHIDFLLCERDSVRPVLAVELDDSSHLRSDRRKRDEFVDSVFAAAELPLLRVRAKRAYDSVEIRKAVYSRIGVDSSNSLDGP